MLLALTLALAQASAVPASDRGSTLYRQCRQGMLVDEGDKSASYVDASLCVGYIDGFTDGLSMAGSKAICVENASLGTIARVYVMHMDKNPKQLDVERSVGLIDALLENYSCPSSRAKPYSNHKP